MIDISGENVVLVGALLLFVAVKNSKVAYTLKTTNKLLIHGEG